MRSIFLAQIVKVNWGSRNKGTCSPLPLCFWGTGLRTGLRTSHQPRTPAPHPDLLLCDNLLEQERHTNSGAGAHDGGGAWHCGQSPSQAERTGTPSLTANALQCPTSRNVTHSLWPESPRSRNVTVTHSPPQQRLPACGQAPSHS